jgi:4a-hydroxytetrahydrobiopterin dehydratase
MKVYNKQESADQMQEKGISGWTYENDGIDKEFTFDNFIQAFSFMTASAIWAEKHNHHPEWSNVYNKVKVRLSTHDSGGVTDKDFALAEKMDQIYGG